MLKNVKAKWMVVILSVVVGVCITLTVIHNIRPAGYKERFRERQINTIALSKMNLTESVSAAGTIESIESRTITADISGVDVKEVFVSVGDYVEKGDKLVKFDESSLKEELVEAKENYSSSESLLDREIAGARSRVSDAKNNYDFDVAKAEKEIDSSKESIADIREDIKTIKKQIKVSRNETEKYELEKQLSEALDRKKQAETSYDNAVSNLDSVKRQGKSNIESAENSLETAKDNKQRTLKEAQKKVDEVRENLEKCSVTASISGLVTSVGVKKGESYNGGIIAVIEDTGSYAVTVSVDEYDIGNVAMNQKVVIITDATDDAEFEGRVTFIAPSKSSTGSAGNSQSGEVAGTGSSSSDGYEVKITLEDIKDDRLKLGVITYKRFLNQLRNKQGLVTAA